MANGYFVKRRNRTTGKEEGPAEKEGNTLSEGSIEKTVGAADGGTPRGCQLTFGVDALGTATTAMPLSGTLCPSPAVGGFVTPEAAAPPASRAPLRTPFLKSDLIDEGVTDRTPFRRSSRPEAGVADRERPRDPVGAPLVKGSRTWLGGLVLLGLGGGKPTPLMLARTGSSAKERGSTFTYCGGLRSSRCDGTGDARPFEDDDVGTDAVSDTDVVAVESVVTVEVVEGHWGLL